VSDIGGLGVRSTNVETMERGVLREVGILRGIDGVLIAGLVLCGGLFSSGANAQKSRGPFSKDEIVDLLKSGVTPARVAGLVREFHVSFQLSPAIEEELRSAGTTDELFRALRESAPTPTPTPPKPTPTKPPPPPVLGPLLIKSNPAGAQAFLDGKPVGTTNTEGELELSQLPVGEHTVRLTLAGYEDYEETTNLVAGQQARISATLKSVPPRPPRPPPAKFRVTLELKGKHCPGELVIGNETLQFRADRDDCDSFDSPLKDITYGTVAKRAFLNPNPTLVGFYLRPADGKDRSFQSDSTVAILQLLQQLGSRH
jgi:hypothetical protein